MSGSASGRHSPSACDLLGRDVLTVLGAQQVLQQDLQAERQAPGAVDGIDAEVVQFLAARLERGAGSEAVLALYWHNALPRSFGSVWIEVDSRDILTSRYHATAPAESPDRQVLRRRVPRTERVRRQRSCARSTRWGGRGCGWRRTSRTPVVVAIVIVAGVPTGRTSSRRIIIIGLLLTSIGRGLAPDTAGAARLAAVHRCTARSTTAPAAWPTRSASRCTRATSCTPRRWLFGGVEPTRLAAAPPLQPRHVYWYDALCTLIYTTHFLATPVLAAVLWIRDRALWLRYITRVIVLSVAGLITYCLFPEAPPWLAARDGLTEPVARLSARGWIWLHAGNVNSALATRRTTARTRSPRCRRCTPRSRPSWRCSSAAAALAVALAAGAVSPGDGLHARLPRRALRARPARRCRLRAGGAPRRQPVGAAPGRQGPAQGGGPTPGTVPAEPAPAAQPVVPQR